ncbi:hypothetical protein [Piscinibacter sp.]|uniref:hypothetical protein n=1 Tax=Piscinibacter sp. TaxID=1903157 RepID=UPI002CEEC5C9|nr:hypothetical protein [Albitalea sp.]HUG21751.1 hypothetical protein [Albitalea sp.]
MDLVFNHPLLAWWPSFLRPERLTPLAHLDERMLRDIGLQGAGCDQLQRLGIRRVDEAAARIETPFRVRRSVL